MATGKLPKEVLNTNTNITFTPNLIISGQEKMFANKYGHVVTLNGYVRINSIPSDAATTGVTIGTIPSDFRPQESVRVPCGISNNAWEIPAEVGYFAVFPESGELVFKTNQTGSKAVYVSCSWVV